MVSARIHYASLALVELALQRDGGAPVAVREITCKHGIPGPFLVQILRTLRSVGWIKSIRGSQGGYRLNIDPSEITLLDVYEAVGCADSGFDADTTSSSESQLLNQVWETANRQARRVLEKTTIAELCKQAAANDEVMFYI